MQPLQCQVMPLSLLPWQASNHSPRGKKFSLYCPIRKVSPQGNPWVHKEGIYIESVWANTGVWHGRCWQLVAVQEMLTILFPSSNRIIPIKRWQQLDNMTMTIASRWPFQIQTFSPKLVAAATAVLKWQWVSAPRNTESMSSFMDCLTPAPLRRPDTIPYPLIVFQAQPTLS